MLTFWMLKDGGLERFQHALKVHLNAQGDNLTKKKPNLNIHLFKWEGSLDCYLMEPTTKTMQIYPYKAQITERKDKGGKSTPKSQTHTKKFHTRPKKRFLGGVRG